MDQPDLCQEIFNFLSDLEESTNIDLNIKPVKFDKIMICGMGESAISGDILRDCIINDINYPITIQRVPELPEWVNENTIIIISYSENTSDILSLYNQAAERGCTIVVATVGGGILEDSAKKRGDILIEFEPKFQSSNALGMNLGYLINIIDSVCDTDYCSEVRKLFSVLYKFRDKLTSDKGMAWKIAKGFEGKIPVIYAASGIYASALRWKSQINEISKMRAYAESVPEVDHNENLEWSTEDFRNKYIPMFIYETRSSRSNRKMLDASITAMKNYGQDVKVVYIRGKTVLERTLRAIMIGDHVSLQLAHFNGVDITNVKSTNECGVHLKTSSDNNENF